LLGGVGLVLPALLRFQSHLTPWAAIGIVAIMLLAVAYHLSRGEMSAVPMTVISGAFAAFIAWGRFTKAPIHNKKTIDANTLSTI
jgi:putative oxidoreductase